MANIFPDEGIEYLFDIILDMNLQVGLFDSHAPNLVPDRFAELGGLGVSEMTGDGYQRQIISAGNWGTPATDGNGLLITSSQTVSFGPSVGGDWLPANGFFVAVPISNIAIYYANFDSEVARVVTTLHKISVTPAIRIGN